MANTYVDYTATAAQTDFAFNFPYLEDEHVIVEINGVATTDFTIVTSPALKVVLNSGATAGDIVRVRRVSQRNTNLVDFQNGSVLTEAELDRAYLHNRYLAEEISELNDQSLQIEAGGTEWNAKGLRIKNVGTPTDTTDASTKLYVDNKVNQVIYGGDAPLKWQFTGTAGVNTTYTVTGAEIDGDTAYDVSINGLVQEPTVDYTVNPDTDILTINSTLSGGEDIVIIQRGFGISVTGTVGSAQLVNGAITTEKLADGAVTTDKIDADAVNGSKIADDSIDSEHYVDGSIDEAHIADEAITSGKISTTDTNFNVQSDGKVGIGTNTPDSLLHLGSNGSITMTDLTGEFWKIQPGTYRIAFKTWDNQNSIVFHSDSSGNPTYSFIKNKVLIGTNSSLTPDSAAILDVSGSNGGILFPRLTTTQRNAMSPANGLVIYNTTANKFQGYANYAWVDLH